MRSAQRIAIRARSTCALALAVAGAVSFGCGGISSPSNNTVESFPGTLTVSGAAGHFFSVSKTGEYIIKLTALAPNPNAVVGLALVAGNSDNSCSTSVFQRNDFSTLNVQALGGQIISGRYCALIYDVGGISAAQTYTISVSHP